MKRKILHINVANFAAAVEELCDSTLRGRPFVIAPLHARRGVVLDVSESAFREGLRKGMFVRNVERMPGVRIIEPRFDLYTRAEGYLQNLVLPLAPVVEGISGGHLFLDISGTRKLFGNPTDHAARIKREIAESLGIVPIVGLALNRLVSKVATRVVKPDGFITVPTGDERTFLTHQDITLLPGIGAKLSEYMHMLGIREVGELAQLPTPALVSALGRRGLRLKEAAQGIDFTPVQSEPAQARTIREETVLENDTNDLDEVEAKITTLAEDGGIRMRQSNMAAGAAELTLFYSDGVKDSARMNLEQFSHCDRDILEAGRTLLWKMNRRRVRIRKLALTLSKLQEGGRQLDLFVPEMRIKRESLQKSVDAIRTRFGRTSIQIASAFQGRRA